MLDRTVTNRETTRMSDTQTPKRQRFQFRLVTLLAWTTLLAVFFSLIQLFGLWLAILFATYLFAIAAVRTEFGHGQGAVVAAIGTAIVTFPLGLMLAPNLAIGVLAVLIGLVLGYICFILVHSLALIGAWDIFKLNQNREGLVGDNPDSPETK